MDFKCGTEKDLFFIYHYMFFFNKFLVRLHGEYNLFSFVETPRKFIIAELSIRKLGSSSVLIISGSANNIISTDEDPSLRIESSAIINLRGVCSLFYYIFSPFFKKDSQKLWTVRCCLLRATHPRTNAIL